MSIIEPPANSENFGRFGLSELECKALHDVAYRLMVDDRSAGVGQVEDDDGVKCIHVLDIRGDRYSVGRNAGAYLLVDPELRIIAVSKRFDDILEALRNSL